jgi:hypothetical protein
MSLVPEPAENDFFIAGYRFIIAFRNPKQPTADNEKELKMKTCNR